MDHKGTMESVINREKSPYLPAAFWRHFPVDDLRPESLARSTVAFQQMFNCDFVKVSPPSSFCLRDWGAEDEWFADPEGTRDYLGAVIQRPEDWAKLSVLDPRSGHLGNQLECLKMIKKALPPDTPFIQTIFSPLSQAKNLAGKSDILHHIRQYPEQFKLGLETITQTTQLFIEECLKVGIDGIFYAVQHATYDQMTESEFLGFGKTFDARFFGHIKPFWLNVLHIHGSHVMFDLVSDYPFQVFNWHDRETLPDLAGGFQKIQGAVCGGLSRIDAMVLGEKEEIEKEFEDALRQTGGTGFILGTGCVCPLTTPLGNIFNAIDLAHSHKS
ncbi:MAG: uroporphyrinogen decarboxylase [Chloroflexi bacterium]|nr:uroporphyrinogen decarboxylase [Chloroflexota bacterium]